MTTKQNQLGKAIALHESRESWCIQDNGNLSFGDFPPESLACPSKAALKHFSGEIMGEYVNIVIGPGFTHIICAD